MDNMEELEEEYAYEVFHYLNSDEDVEFFETMLEEYLKPENFKKFFMRWRIKSEEEEDLAAERYEDFRNEA